MKKVFLTLVFLFTFSVTSFSQTMYMQDSLGYHTISPSSLTSAAPASLGGIYTLYPAGTLFSVTTGSTYPSAASINNIRVVSCGTSYPYTSCTQAEIAHRVSYVGQYQINFWMIDNSDPLNTIISDDWDSTYNFYGNRIFKVQTWNGSSWITQREQAFTTAKVAVFPERVTVSGVSWIKGQLWDNFGNFVKFLDAAGNNDRNISGAHSNVVFYVNGPLRASLLEGCASNTFNNDINVYTSTNPITVRAFNSNVVIYSSGYEGIYQVTIPTPSNISNSNNGDKTGVAARERVCYPGGTNITGTTYASILTYTLGNKWQN